MRGGFRGRGFRGRFRGGWRGRGGRRPAVFEPGFPKSCEICQISSLQNKFQLEKHNVGKRHLKNLRKEEIRKQSAKTGSDSTDAKSSKESKYISVNTETSRRMCTLCQVEFTSDEIETSHMKGSRHLTNVRKARTGGVVKINKKTPNLGKCELCNVIYNSQIMKDGHIYGKRHRASCIKGNLPIPTRPNKRDSNELSAASNALITRASQKTKTSTPVVKATTVTGQIATGAATPSTPTSDVATRTILLEPPKKMQKRAPVAAPITPQYQILEKKAEEAYEHYLEVAKANPDDAVGNQALYTQYQAIYKAYERAYGRHVRELNAQGAT